MKNKNLKLICPECGSTTLSVVEFPGGGYIPPQLRIECTKCKFKGGRTEFEQVSLLRYSARNERYIDKVRRELEGRHNN